MQLKDYEYMYLRRSGKYVELVYNYELTGAYRPIACVSSVAKAGVISWTVVASCIIMTASIAYSTLIHICSSKVTTVIVIVHDC